VLLSIVGTLITDTLSTIQGESRNDDDVFRVALAVTFISWFASEKTLSIHTIVTTGASVLLGTSLDVRARHGQAPRRRATRRRLLKSALLFAGMIAVINRRLR